MVTEPKHKLTTGQTADPIQPNRKIADCFIFYTPDSQPHNHNRAPNCTQTITREPSTSKFIVSTLHPKLHCRDEQLDGWGELVSRQAIR